MKCKNLVRILSFVASLATPLLCLNTLAGAKIAWVSFHPADNTPSANAAAAGFTQAPDVEYTRLLAAAGHQVTRYVTTATPDTNFLNGFDVVIIGRSVPSGNYQTAASTALWHSLTKPTMVMGGYILRNSRLGYTTGGTIPDTVAPIRLTVNDPTHPIFTGVSLDAANLMVNPYANIVSFNGTTQRGISVNTDQPVDGAIVLATVGTDTDPAFGGMIIAEIPAGTTMADASGDVTAAKRLVFLSGSRENVITSEGAGIFDLTTDGARLFLNGVNYLADLPVTEPPPLISNVRPANGATNYYAAVGLSFEATSGTAGGIPLTNISLTLNGSNVSSGLVITGTPQDRSVTYTNLANNTTYAAVITVRDDSGHEVSQTINFDTLPPFSLPEAFAFPISDTNSAQPGFKARIAEALSATTLPNTIDRALQQLDGTLIDSTTGAPFPNNATPSTDNPDGSYNEDLINWSLEAGVTERGDFQAPDFPDQPIPGISQNNNLAAEILTYIELQPGRYVMGVNSDDGFVVYAGANPRDLFATPLGRFDGSRGSADTTFPFLVTKAGLYPFRLVYYQGDGGGNLEWFMQDPLTGAKTLLNDRSNTNAVRAWRDIGPVDRPYILSVLPNPAAIGVNTDTNIIISLQDGGAQVQQNSIQLSLNGQSVTPQITKTGEVTTVSYTPSPLLQGDTKYTVNLAYTDTASTQLGGTFDFTTRYVPPPATNGAKIVWVSFHAADDQPSANAAAAGFTEAPDVGYTKLLTEAGHTVTRYVTTATPDVAYLDTFDLVIIGRSVPSGNYQTADSTALWHSITKPTIVMGGYVMRASRLGYTTGETIPDTAGTVRLKVNNPAHPIFQGITLDASNVTPDYAHIVSFNGTTQRGISVNTSPVIPGANVLATVATVGDPAVNGMVIGEYPAGTQMGDASADVTAGKRLVFLSGSRENGITGEGAGIFDLDGAGSKMFLNAVNYMAGLSGTTPGQISVSAAIAANGQITISWPEAGATGYTLQSNVALSATGWQPVAGTPTSANGTLSLTLPASDAASFFRLVHP